MKYLLLIEDDGQWYASSRDGALVVTGQADFWVNKDMPLIGLHEKNTLPVFDMDEELDRIYREFRDGS